MLRVPSYRRLMFIRLAACSLACCLALGSARAQSALTPPRQERLRRPAVNSQEGGQVTLSDSVRPRRTKLIALVSRPVPHLTVPRIPIPRAGTRVVSTPVSRPVADTGQRLTGNGRSRFAWTRVSYLSGGSVYLDAGTKQGLKVGTHLDVMRDTSFVAELVVEYVSSNRASCSVVRSILPVVVGDSARYPNTATTDTRTIAANALGAAASDAHVARRNSLLPVRGRIGVRYLRSDPGLGPASVLIRPAFDMRVDGHQMNGTPFGITLDVRAYRDRRATATGNVTRVYQGALEVSPARTGARVTLGRQYSAALTPIGIFDGISVDVDKSRWSGGLLAGSQPEPLRFGLSTAIKEYGAYVQLHNETNAAPVWSTTLGAIGSYAGGEIDREFAYVQSTLTSSRLSLYAAQEVDVNRGWKSDAESSAVVPTSTFAMLRLNVTSDFQLNVGYDGRRSVRLYRDFLTPEIEFDDSFRRGTWGGATVTALGHIRVSADARRSSGGAGGANESYTGSFSVHRLTPLQLGVRGRATSYAGDVARGSLVSAAVEATPIGSLHLEGTAGLRRDLTATDSSAHQNVRGHEVSADLGIGRSVYVLVSVYRENGVRVRSSQAYVALSYRF